MNEKTVAGRLKRWGGNLVLVFLGIVLALLLMELLVATIKPQQVRMATGPDNFFLRYDPETGWMNREGAQGVSAPRKEVPAYAVRINSQGFRGGEVAVPKRPGTRRIAFLGDSNTFGYGMQEGERFSDLLAARAPAGTEILNFGVVGFGTDQEAILLEKQVLRFAPDLVVLAVSPGDLSVVMNSVSAGAAKPFFTMVNGALAINNIPVPPSTPLLSSRSLQSRAKVFLYRHSHLYRLLHARVLALNRYMVNSVQEMNEKEAFEVMVQIIRGMRQVCAEGGSGFKVLFISHGEWIEGMRHSNAAPIGYYRQLKQALTASGIEVIDPTEKFVAWQGEELYFTHDAVHLTAAGNRMIARELEKILSPSRPGSDRSPDSPSLSP